MIEKQDETILAAFRYATKGARELPVFTQVRALLIEAQTIKEMSAFKPTEFAGALVDAVSAENAAATKNS